MAIVVRNAIQVFCNAVPAVRRNVLLAALQKRTLFIAFDVSYDFQAKKRIVGFNGDGVSITMRGKDQDIVNWLDKYYPVKEED